MHETGRALASARARWERLMKNAGAIAERLEHDLRELMARLMSLAVEIRRDNHQAGPVYIHDLHRLGGELAACLKRLREPDRN